jgi:hypothetical protein
MVKNIFTRDDCTIAYGPDLEGNVAISDGFDGVNVPGSALRAFISQWLRERAERRIQLLSDEEMLKEAMGGK